MVARALAILHTCIFDAWAAYDKKIVGTRLGGSLRRPEARVRDRAPFVSARKSAFSWLPRTIWRNTHSLQFFSHCVAGASSSRPSRRFDQQW